MSRFKTCIICYTRCYSFDDKDTYKKYVLLHDDLTSEEVICFECIDKLANQKSELSKVHKNYFPTWSGVANW